MSDSVAGKIRFDILANTAGFKASCAEAKREAKTLADDMTRIDRQMASKGNAAKRSTTEQGAWRGLMENVTGGYSLQGEADAVQFRGRSLGARRADMLQRAKWSKPYEVPGEGGDQGGMLDKLGLGSASEMFGKVKGFATNPLTLAAATIVATGKATWDKTREEIGRATKVNGLAGQYGSGAKDASIFDSLGLTPEKMHGTRTVSELEGIAGSLGKLTDPSDRAALAFKHFGEDAAEVMPILANLKQRMDDIPQSQIVSEQQVQQVNALQNSLKGLSSRGLWASFKDAIPGMVQGVEDFGSRLAGNIDAVAASRDRQARGESPRSMASRLTGVVQSAELAGYYMLGDSGRAAQAMGRQAQDNWKAENPEFARKKEQAEKEAEAAVKQFDAALKNANASLRGLDNQLQDQLRGPGASARDKFIEDLEAGLKNKEGRALEFGSSAYDKREQEIARKTAEYDDKQRQLEELRGKQNLRTNFQAEDKTTWDNDSLYENKMQRLREWQSARIGSEEAYKRVRLKYLSEYYQAEFGLDAKRLEDATKTGLDILNRERSGLAGMRSEGVISEEARGRGDRDARDRYRSSLGISDPVEMYRRKQEELEAAKKAGEITPEEYDRQSKRNKRSAVGESLADQQDLQLMGAARSGSAAAYSMVVQSEVNDPKVQLARDTVTKLDSIDKTLKTLAGGAADVGKDPW